jgi:diguanylate cyclase (GGDEF)-like protein
MGFGEKLAAASERAAQAKSPLALLYIDLDGFKAVNDEFGHDVGDELLQVVARRLLDRIRPSDTVARLGGDEFAVLVEGIDDRRQLAAIAERLECAFDEPLAVCGRNFGLRASVGCAVWPDDVSDHRELLRHADAAMYEVKRARQAKAASTPVQIRSESALRV